MATDQYLMAEGTCLKVAPLTENGNNCPTSEQAPNRVPKELWPPFLGSERVRERYASNLADVPGRIASVSARGETPPAKAASIPSVHPVTSTSCGRNRGMPMKSDVVRPLMVLVMGFGLALTSAELEPAQASALPSQSQNEAQQPGQATDGQRMPLLGKITAVHQGSLDVADTNGDTVTVKINGQTEFRKDRQPAKRNDFKVGDIIVVRGEENPDHSWTAHAVAARSMNGPNGPNGRGGPGGPGGRLAQTGTLGKDYVAGEIK